jgi:hypothetical protein
MSVWRHVADMSADMTLSRQNCRHRHPTFPTKQEWEAKPAADKTWANIKSFISTEYAKKNKQNKLTARQFKANAIQQQAEAMEEIINALTEKHTEQMENLIKSTTEVMKKMMELVQSSNKGNNNDKASKDDKKKK